MNNVRVEWIQKTNMNDVVQLCKQNMNFIAVRKHMINPSPAWQLCFFFKHSIFFISEFFWRSHVATVCMSSSLTRRQGRSPSHAAPTCPTSSLLTFAHHHITLLPILSISSRRGSPYRTDIEKGVYDEFDFFCVGVAHFFRYKGEDEVDFEWHRL